MSLFRSIFCTIPAFSLKGEYVVRSFLLNGVFYLVTTGRIFYIRLCENSINQSINGHTYSKSMDQPGKVANRSRGQLNRENEYFPVRVRA